MLVNCKQGEKRRPCRETLQSCFEVSRVSFHISAKALSLFDALTYLGRTIAYDNRYWPAVYQNLKKSWRRWGVITRVLEKTGAKVWARGMMHKALAYLVILYGSKSWLVAGRF